MKTFTAPSKFSDKKYPTFIQKSIILKAYNKPEKVFPRIGLKNCEVALSSIKFSEYEKYQNYLNKFIEIIDNLPDNTIYPRNPFLSNDLNILVSEAECYSNQFIIKINKTYKIQIPKSLKFSCIKPNKTRDFFDAVEQIKTHLKTHGIKSDLEKLSLNSKDKISDLIFLNKKAPSKNMKVCFSSDGNKGYWDIATMSMRGIKSCMNWDSQHSKSLVGSIVDPYAAIIYLTDGTKTSKGNKMLARSVVRFVVSRNKEQKPAIMIENPYFATLNYNKAGILSVFASFIRGKVGNMPVIYYNNEFDGNGHYSIPLSEPTEEIEELKCDYYLSYRDSDIEYNKIKKFFDPKKVKIK